MLPYRKRACHGSQLPLPQFSYSPPPLSPFLCISFVFFLYFTIFFLYLATEDRKEGEKFIPDSLLVLCVSVKLVPDGSIVITQHEQAAPIPGL
jgi:hypothetical protein